MKPPLSETKPNPSRSIQRAKPLWLLAFICLTALLAGCASPQQYVHFPDQSKRIEDPEKARLYVMRPSKVARNVSMVVKDGRKTIGSTGPNSYLCWERDPGLAKISGIAENSAAVELTVEKGQVYYIFQHLVMGMWAQADKLEVVNEEEGQKALRKCNPPNTQ